MANNWFAFKQFKVEQALCGMKVSTDACVLGAYTCHAIQQPILNGLDIGTGTGLLSLMLVQNKQVQHMLAIDIEPNAIQQAQQNFHQSPWSHKLKAEQMDIRNWQGLTNNSFDLIICNPPFFERQLQATENSKNIARHEVLFSKTILAAAVANLLTMDGKSYILYPVSEWEAWLEAAAQAGLYAHAVLTICPNRQKPANRMIGVFGKQMPDRQLEETLVIREGEGNYSIAFMDLLHDFYLQFK